MYRGPRGKLSLWSECKTLNPFGSSAVCEESGITYVSKLGRTHAHVDGTIYSHCYKSQDTSDPRACGWHPSGFDGNKIRWVGPTRMWMALVIM